MRRKKIRSAANFRQAVSSYRHSDRSGGIFFVCGIPPYERRNANGKPAFKGREYGVSCKKNNAQCADFRCNKDPSASLGMTKRGKRHSRIAAFLMQGRLNNCGASLFDAPRHHFAFLILSRPVHTFPLLSRRRLHYWKASRGQRLLSRSSTHSPPQSPKASWTALTHHYCRCRRS